MTKGNPKLNPAATLGKKIDKKWLATTEALRSSEWEEEWQNRDAEEEEREEEKFLAAKAETEMTTAFSWMMNM